MKKAQTKSFEIEEENKLLAEMSKEELTEKLASTKSRGKKQRIKRILGI